jgi:hypothetical protein
MLQQVADLYRMTGTKPTLRIGIEEEIVQVYVSADKCWIIMRRARTQPRKYGYVVTHRGVQTILFKRVGGTTWHRDQQTLWTPLPVPERVSPWPGRTPAEDAARREWEDLCHRPGTHASPLDNADRKAQGYGST